MDAASTTVGVIGLGYVGLPTAIGFLDAGFEVCHLMMDLNLQLIVNSHHLLIFNTNLFFCMNVFSFEINLSVLYLNDFFIM